MRFSALLLIGLGVTASAQAQSGPPPVEFLPIPETMPELLFAPEPLAGSMLKPLAEPAPDGLAEAVEASGERAEEEAPPATVAQAPPAEAPAAPPAAVSETDAAAGGDAPPAGEIDASPDAAAEMQTATIPATAPQALPDAPETTIHVIIENVESDLGVVNVAVCDTALSREGCPYDTAVPASLGFVEAKFEGIPPGTYAVVGYHDVNGNDVFDKFLGVPREPYALSSDAGEQLFPTFDDAALSINEGENVVIIRMQRLGGE